MAETSYPPPPLRPPLPQPTHSQCFTPLMDSIQTPLPTEGDDARYFVEKELSLRLSRDFEFGPHADSELYADLARAFLRCKMRSRARAFGVASSTSTITATDVFLATNNPTMTSSTNGAQQHRLNDGHSEKRREESRHEVQNLQSSSRDELLSEKLQMEELSQRRPPPAQGVPPRNKERHEYRETQSAHFNNFCEDWDLSEEETDKGQSSTKFDSTTTIKSNCSDSSSPQLKFMDSRSEESSASSSPSSMSDDEEDIAEELQNMHVDHQNYVGAISTEDEAVVGEDRGPCPLNLLRDFEGLGTQDQSSTKENTAAESGSNINDNPLAVPKEVTNPLSARSINKSKNDVDDDPCGMGEMIGKSTSYSTSPICKKSPLSSSLNVLESYPTSGDDVPNMREANSIDSKSDKGSVPPESGNDGDVTQSVVDDGESKNSRGDARDISTTTLRDTITSDVSNGLEKPFSKESPRFDTGNGTESFPISGYNMPNVQEVNSINTESNKKSAPSKSHSSGYGIFTVSQLMDEGGSEKSIGDSKMISATSSRETETQDFSDHVENNSMDPYPEGEFDDSDLFSPQHPTSGIPPPSFSTIPTPEPASSFEFNDPLFSMAQFEIGSANMTTSGSKRNKGRRKASSSPRVTATVPQPSPSSIGRHSREEKSTTPIFRGDKPLSFKFNVDLTSEKKKNNANGVGYKFGKRFPDGKSKTTFANDNTTAIPITGGTSSSHVIPPSTSRLFDGNIAEDAMDVDEVAMDVDLPAQQPSSIPARVTDEGMPVNTKAAHAAINLGNNSSTNSFSIGSEGDTASMPAIPVNTKAAHAPINLGNNISTNAFNIGSGGDTVSTSSLGATISTKSFTIGSGGDTSSASSSKMYARLSAKARKSRISPKPPGLSRTGSTESIDVRQLRTSWSDNNSVVSQSQNDLEVDEAARARDHLVSSLREEGRFLYVSKNYKESVLKYTAAIGASTDDFTNFPNPKESAKSSELLASLYGNRAAALMMISAFEAAASDCQKALGFIRKIDSQLSSIDNYSESLTLPTRLNGDGGLMLMTKLLIRKGRAYAKLGQTNEAQKTFENAIKVAQSSLLSDKKIHRMYTEKENDIPSEIFLNQCISDARLNLTEIKRVIGLIEAINSNGGVRSDVDAPMAKIKNRQMYERVNSVLSSAPANVEMVAGKIFCLGSMRKWIELALFCEQLACKHSKFDGVFTRDLEEFNPYPLVQVAEHLHPNIFSNETENFDNILNHKQVAEAVLRLPYGIVPIYTRALRLAERYIEAGKAIETLSSHAEKARPVWSPIKQRQKARYYWLASERDKLRRTIASKTKGDECYKNAEYQRAAESYTSALKIDGEGSHIKFSCDPWDFETAGGRLHAVLHCNRAACLMALKEYQSAAKECTAALRVESQYMKATLRRARCYMRLERYEECIAEYKCWSNLVDDSRRTPSPDDECNFDRASDVSDRDYRKVSAELVEVQSIKREADMQARARTEAANNASARRQQWYDQKGEAGTRRWDSFGGTSPKKEKRQSSRRFPSASTRQRTDNTRTKDSPNTRHFSNSRQNKDTGRKKDSPSLSSVTCHYDILQVSKMTSQGDIKKAYRKMALKYHPDKNSGNSAEIFRKVKMAYETLSDENARKQYDIKNLRQYDS